MPTLDPLVLERIQKTVEAYSEYLISYASLHAVEHGHLETITEEDIKWARARVCHINPCETCRYDKTKEFCGICSPCHPKYWDFKQ